MSQTTETQTQKPEAPKREGPKPIECTFKLQAFDLLEAIRAAVSVVGYGYDTKEGPLGVGFYINKDGIGLRQMDPSRVAMIDFELTKRGFDNYKAKQTGVLTFDADSISRILKGVKKQTIGADSAIKTEGEMLNLIVNGVELTMEITHTEYSRTWKLRALEPEYDEKESPLPDLKYSVVFKCSKTQLQRVVDDAVKATDHLMMIADEAGVHFEGNSTDTMTTYNGELSKDALLSYKNNTDKARAVYNLGFLQSILKDLPKDTEILTFSFSDNMPCQIKTGQFDKLDYYLAPRIIQDD